MHPTRPFNASRTLQIQQAFPDTSGGLKWRFFTSAGDSCWISPRSIYIQSPLRTGTVPKQITHPNSASKRKVNILEESAQFQASFPSAPPPASSNETSSLSPKGPRCLKAPWQRLDFNCGFLNSEQLPFHHATFGWYKLLHSATMPRSSPAAV